MNITNKYHFNKLQCHFKLNIQFFACCHPLHQDKIKLLDMVQKKSNCTNQAMVDVNSKKMELLGHIIIVLDFKALQVPEYLWYFHGF